jgi:hypothetical protein
MAISKVGDSITFSYTGNIQEYTIPISGLYKLEAYGGKGGDGGNGSASLTGGYGGYEYGYKVLNKDDLLYIVCGGAGEPNMKNSLLGGGYNGGYDGLGQPWYPQYTYAGGGGGATHIATMTGLLSEIGIDNIDKVLLIAGGGGGSNGPGVGGTNVYGQPGGGDSGGGSGSFGIGTKSGSYGPGGGAGYDSGDREYGGTGYNEGNIIFNGRTYFAGFTNGINTGDGYAILTLIASSSLPVYYNNTQLEKIIYNDTTITSLYYNDTKLY